MNWSKIFFKTLPTLSINYVQMEQTMAHLNIFQENFKNELIFLNSKNKY